MITVDADEVTPNAEYTCNITGRVPPFTGVQLGKLSVYNHSIFLPYLGGEENLLRTLSIASYCIVTTVCHTYN